MMRGDIITLEAGMGLVKTNQIYRLTLSKDILEYLNLTNEGIDSKEAKIVLKFEYCEKTKTPYIEMRAVR